jgi:hypothetical protein
MNWAILLGVLFAAASAYFLAYGTHLANRRNNAETADTVRTELAKFSERVATVQKSVSVQPSGVTGTMETGKPSPNAASQRQAQQELADIEKDFSNWASNFIRNRDLKKLELDRQQLEARTTEMEISTKYRPLFQYAVDCLRGIINAYNEKAGSKFKAEFHDLPSNLYPHDNLIFNAGTIDFGDANWNFYIACNKPADPNNPPIFQIDIHNAGISSSDSYRIQIFPGRSLFQLFAFGGGVATAAKIETSHSLENFEEPMRSSLERLVETQISYFPSH